MNVIEEGRAQPNARAQPRANITIASEASYQSSPVGCSVSLDLSCERNIPDSCVPVEAVLAKPVVLAVNVPLWSSAGANRSATELAVLMIPRTSSHAEVLGTLRE